MKIVKLTLPLEAYAKSLFKDTIGNDLNKRHICKNANIMPKDTFVKSKNIQTGKLFK